MYLHVADLDQAETFYREVLGFDSVSRYGSATLSVSAGGYHHHIGLNTWTGRGAPPPPPDAVGLRYFTIILPDEAARRRLLAHLQDAGVSLLEITNGPKGHELGHAQGHGKGYSLAMM